MLDFYEAIKYVTSHASDLGVDVSKIAIAGKKPCFNFKLNLS